MNRVLSAYLREYVVTLKGEDAANKAQEILDKFDAEDLTDDQKVAGSLEFGKLSLMLEKAGYPEVSRGMLYAAEF